MISPWMKCCLVIVLVLSLQALPVEGDVYSWTDANGVRHYSNEPPPSGQNAKQQDEIRHDNTRYREWDEARQNEQAKILEKNRDKPQDARKSSRAGQKTIQPPGRVVMYVTPTCGYCKRAKSFFQEHGIGFDEFDVTTDKAAARRFKELRGNGVPLILVGDKRIAGFNQPLLRKLFGIGPARKSP